MTAARTSAGDTPAGPPVACSLTAMGLAAQAGRWERIAARAAGCECSADLGGMEITITPPGRVDLEMARRYARLGVHWPVIQPVTEDGSDMEDVIESARMTLIGRV
jgi:hypothetical protein